MAKNRGWFDGCLPSRHNMGGELRKLAMILSKLPKHPQKSVELEQYSTEGDFAARWIAAIIECGDISEESNIIDFGAGNGILGIGLLLAGVSTATFIEKDEEAVESIRVGIKNMDLENKSLIICKDIVDCEQWLNENEYDLIIMNPPWGFQNPKADRPFLELAFSSSAPVIHLLHSANVSHPQAIARDAGWNSELLLEGSFRLPAQYEHHRKPMAESAVKCWRFYR